MNPGLLLAALNDPALAQEPDGTQAPEVPCVAYVVEADPKLELKSYQRAEQIMKGLFPLGDHPEECLEARVRLTLDKDGAADLSLTAKAPAHRMQDPEAAKVIPLFKEGKDLATLPVEVQTTPEWFLQAAGFPRSAAEQLVLGTQGEKALSLALKAPAAELKENLQTWLQVNAESMGPLREAERYSLNTWSIQRGTLLERWKPELEAVLKGMSDPEEGAKPHSVELRWLRNHTDSHTHYLGGGTGESCQAYPGDARVVEITDTTTQETVWVSPEAACVTDEEVKELTKQELRGLKEDEQAEVSAAPTVKVMVMWPRNATPNQQTEWTAIVEAAAARASTYVARYYLPKQELPPVINLYVDLDFSRSTPLHIATDLNVEGSRVTAKEPINSRDDAYFAKVRAGDGTVLVPFHSFEGDFNGGLRPGSELDSDAYSWTGKPMPKSVSKNELAQSLAAGMIQSLNSWVGQPTDSSVEWTTSAFTEPSGGVPANRQKAAIDAGFDHICTEFDVGDDGRSLSVGANWRGMLPIGVKAINKEGKGDPCTPEVGLTFNVLGLDVTVGTSKEEK